MVRIISSLSAGLALLVAVPAAGQNYVPDIAEFDGTNGLSFPPDDSLDLAGGGTIEFWVQPDWDADPGFDPAIVSNIGPNGASYMVLMLGSRQGLGVAVGEKYIELAYDFTDGKLHHVSISDYGSDTLAVIINNRPIGLIPHGFGSLPSSGFFIGSADGRQSQFKGAIAALRIWELPIEPNTLAIYANQPVLDNDGSPHPDIVSLAGISDFSKRAFALLEPDPPVAAEPAPEVAEGTVADAAADAGAGAAAGDPVPAAPAPAPVE